jgi:hypothetical protein
LTIRKVIEQWKHIAEDMSGYESDDTTYSDYAIYDHLVLARAVIVKDRNKPEYFTDNMVQTLPCVMFEEVNANECGLIPNAPCTILKTTCPLPNIIKFIGVNEQLGKNLDMVRWDRVEGKLNSRIASIREEPFFAIRTIGDKQWGYIINHKYMKNGVVSAIFENPIQAAQFCGDKEALCNPLEVDFHTDYKLIDPILKLAWNTILTTRRAANYDQNNDDRPDTGEVQR